MKISLKDYNLKLFVKDFFLWDTTKYYNVMYMTDITCEKYDKSI